MDQTMLAEESGGHTLHAEFRDDDIRISFGTALERLLNDPDFRDEIIHLLADSPYRACFWELPPVNRKTLNQPFEFVMSESAHLGEIQADPETFRDQKDFGRSVATFGNPGGDALLIVPGQEGEDPQVYAHLLSFMRGAPPSQKHTLLQTIAEQALGRMSGNPMWISTAGLGVGWLHVRLDSVPKYYSHHPYRHFSG